MKLYNTLSRKVEVFNPIKDHVVSIYSCGPTVYNHIHIGNLSSFIYADLLHRVLKANGYKIDHVMNFTDIDDKTIKRSTERYPADEPMVALKNLTRHYSKIFLTDLKAVGFDINSIKFINATDNILAMQDLIRKLYDNKFAYITEDGVYFSIRAYKEAGKHYGQLTDITFDNTSKARIRNDEYNKESAHDFALWKLRTNNEPAWDFVLDEHELIGRPGWHIECSAMSVENLGQPFDIHTGGIDLIFPHHENEIAQSTATNGDKYANFFVHNEHLLVNGKKMSKSLNNFFTLQDIIEKGFEPLAYRLMILQSHYRSQSNFTWDNLEAAQNRLTKLQVMADLKWQAIGTEKWIAKNKNITAIDAAMRNDLNTPVVLSLLSEFSSLADDLLVCKNELELFNKILKELDSLLGLDLASRKDISEIQKKLIVEREVAREDKNWDKADNIRLRLEQQGIGIRDTDQGTIWFRSRPR